MEISVARALKELKTINARIQNKIYETSFIAGVKKSSKKVNNVLTREEFEKDVKSSYDSITALIERRKQLKSAIVKSNAETKVLIGNIEYTVADAIERKQSIELDKMLLNLMQKQYNNVVANVQKNNDLVEEKLNNLIAQSLSSGVDKKDTAMSGFAEAYRNDNQFEVVDPLVLKTKIDALREYIENFDSECDSTLSESNAVTKILIAD